MLTFKRFIQLAEAFWKGDKGRYGYIEIWKNPTKSEMKEIKYSGGELGAIISGKNLFVWDRSSGEHGDVKRLIRPLAKDWIPLYIYYDHNSNVAKVDVSSYSMEMSGREDYDDKEILDAAKHHPAFKIFSSVRGRWE